jgi:hypothetical protein
VAAKPPGAQPPLDCILQYRLLLMGVPAAPVNDTNAAQAGSDGRQYKFVERETRLLLVHAVQIQPGLNRKPSGAKILQIETAAGLHCCLNVFRSLLDVYIPILQERLERAERILFAVLRLNFEGRPVVQRYVTPSESLDVLHGVAKQVLIGHPCGKRRNRKVSLFSIYGPIRKFDAADSDQIFQDCKRLMHDGHLKRFVIGIRRSRPKALGVILTPGAA